MTINHIGHVFEQTYNPTWWHFIFIAIGLTTYPIMSFLLVEGYHKTRNKWKYLGRITLMWIISILPFHYAFQMDYNINPVNNIMFTLAVGLLMIHLITKTKTNFWIIPAIIITITSDWAIFGVLFTLAFYKGYENKKLILFYSSLVSLFMTALMMFNPITERYAMIGLLLPILLIYHYNGQRGYDKPWFKWFFYLYYPAHMIILILVRYAMNII